MHAVIGKNDAKIGIYVKMVLFSVIRIARQRDNKYNFAEQRAAGACTADWHTAAQPLPQGLKKQQITLYVYENVNSIGSRAAVQLVRAGSA